MSLSPIRRPRVGKLAAAVLAGATLLTLVVGGPAPVAATPNPSPTAPSAVRPGVAGAEARHRIPRLVRQWADAWNTNDPQQMAALFTRDGVYEDFAFGARFTGREGVASWVTITWTALDEVEVDVTDTFRTADRISIRWTFRGQIAGAPRPFAVPASSVLELRNGRIAYAGDYYNLAEVLKQSGLPPELPAPAADSDR
jgi:steroid delta-isomerase-like uncharacterized protein